MDFVTAFNLYNQEQIAKFHTTASKHPASDVLTIPLEKSDLTYTDLFEHLTDEFKELSTAISWDERIKESVDVGNMAFLTWWKAKETASKLAFPWKPI